MQTFRGISHHWDYNHANVYCVATYHQYMKVLVSLNISFFSFEKLLLTWFLWNFKVFVEATIYEPLIMFTPLKYFNHLRFPNNPFCLSKVIVQSRSHWIRSDIIQNKYLPTRQYLFDVTIKFHKFKFCFNFNWNSNWN